MRVVVRVDSSYQIGSGHLMRCITLAEYLREFTAEVVFVCRELPGNLCNLLEDKHFKSYIVPAPERKREPTETSRDDYSRWLGADWKTDAAQTLSVIEGLATKPDWLLVDHYAINYHWEKLLATSVRSLIVIDDLANRRHHCDVLLDHNLSQQGLTRYRGLVPESCRLLCGPGYALLRSEFEMAAASLRERDGVVKRILVFFGGVDAGGMTLKACQAILACGREDLQVDVVIGVANPRQEDVRHVCNQSPIFRCHGQVRNIAEIMAQADLAVGAGGTTTWERAYLGLPSIVVPIAANQVPATEAMHHAGAVWNLGFHTEVTSERLVEALRRAFSAPQELKRMGEIGRELVDGRGSSRVAGVMKELSQKRARK